MEKTGILRDTKKDLQKKKAEVINGNMLETMDKKEKVGNKIDSLWGRSSKSKALKPESKKLIIKLETYGSEKRKLLLKLEGSQSKVHVNNFNLISELLKEFFQHSDE